MLNLHSTFALFILLLCCYFIRLKTWIRSRMSEPRLTGLALLHIHRQENINIDNIIDRFASNKRVLDFVV